MPRAPTPTAEPYLPPRRTVPAMTRACQACRGCELYQKATQAVFGAGPTPARLMLVGEMPGDEEDRTGAPFVGPAGRMLDRALESAGIARAEAYVTNAVKHFQHVDHGARRQHKTPGAKHITACRPWLLAEIAAVDPRVIVALGATAVRGVMGVAMTITSLRGQAVAWPGDAQRTVIATVHPSSILRAPDHAAREAALEGLIADLRRAAAVV